MSPVSRNDVIYDGNNIQNALQVKFSIDKYSPDQSIAPVTLDQSKMGTTKECPNLIFDYCLLYDDFLIMVPSMQQMMRDEDITKYQ